MRILNFYGLLVFVVTIAGACFLPGMYAQSEPPDSMVIQDVDADSSPSAEVVQEGIESVENTPVVKAVPVNPRTSSAAVAPAATRKAASVKDTPTSKQQQDKTIVSVLISIGIFVGSVGVFVFIMIYFFRSRLQQLLDKSSKDRKFLSETFKRFNIDIDKILPPGGPAKK